GALVQGMLLGAAIAPFAVMAYLMRGVELTALLAVFVAVPLAGTGAIVTALLAGCLGSPQRYRGVVQGLLVLALLSAFSSVAPALVSLHSPYGPLSWLSGNPAGVLVGIGAGIAAWVYAMWLQLE